MTSDADLERWVDEEIITAHQADRIRAFERRRAPSHGLVREILGYIGAVLVLTAGFVFIADAWGDMGRWTRIAITAAAALVLAVAGIALARADDRATRRLGQAALMLAAAPLGIAAGLIIDTWAEEDLSVFAGFGAAAAFSIVFYLRERSWAQHIALFISAGGTVIALGVLIGGDSALLLSGALTMVLGTGWLLASLMGILPPRLLSEVGAVVGLGVGSVMVVGDLGSDTTGGLIAMVAWAIVAVVLIAIGVQLDRLILIVGGVLGLLVYLPWIVTEVFGEGAGVPIALLIAGALLIGAAVALTRRARAEP